MLHVWYSRITWQPHRANPKLVFPTTSTEESCNWKMDSLVKYRELIYSNDDVITFTLGVQSVGTWLFIYFCCFGSVLQHMGFNWLNDGFNLRVFPSILSEERWDCGPAIALQHCPKIMWLCTLNMKSHQNRKCVILPNAYRLHCMKCFLGQMYLETDFTENIHPVLQFECQKQTPATDQWVVISVGVSEAVRLMSERVKLALQSCVCPVAKCLWLSNYSKSPCIQMSFISCIYNVWF